MLPFRNSSVYTIQPCTRLQCHFIQSHIGRVYVCLAVNCHLHFWQNDRALLRATAVTRGWHGYRNNSQHRKLTLEKKILPTLLPGLESGAFRSRVQCYNHWAIPAPHLGGCISPMRSPTAYRNTTLYVCRVKCKGASTDSPLCNWPRWSISSRIRIGIQCPVGLKTSDIVDCTYERGCSVDVVNVMTC